MPPAWLRRLLRWAGLTFAGLVVLALAALLLIPLALRGEALGAAIEARLPPMSGQVEVGGGALSPGALVAALLGRGFVVRLDDVLVRDPEGVDVFRAERLSARITVDRKARRVIVDRFTPTDAYWRLAMMRSQPRLGFVAAFLPPGAPAVPLPSRARAAPGWRLDIVDGRLAGVDAEFEFPKWALRLDDVTARGSLSLVPPGAAAAPFSFAVHDIEARGGGRLTLPGPGCSIGLPFSRGRIRQVRNMPEAPTDLLLDVEEGITGGSRLSGQARFVDVLRPPSPARHPAIALAARWSNAGDAVAAMLSSCVSDRVAITGQGATLALDVNGAFPYPHMNMRARGFSARVGPWRFAEVDADAQGDPRAMTAHVSASHHHGGHIAGSLAWGLSGDYRIDVRLRALRAGRRMWMSVPAPLRPLAAGTLDGRVRLSGNAPAQKGRLDVLALALRRRGQGPWPRRVRLTMHPPPSRDRHTATVVVRALSFSADRVEGALASDLFGGQVRLDGALLLAGARPALALSFRADGFDVGRISGRPELGGRVSIAGGVEGALDDPRAHVRVGRSHIRAGGNRYRVRAPAPLRVSGGRLTVPALRFVREGGGSIELGGWLERAGRIDARASFVRHPLIHAVNVGGRDLALSGMVGADLRVTGSLAAPRPSGRIVVARARLAGVRLGAAEAELQPTGRDTRLSLSLAGGAITAEGRLRLVPLPRVELDFAVAGLRVALQPGRRPLRLDGGGFVHLGGDEALRAPAVDGAFDGELRGELALPARLPLRVQDVAAKVRVAVEGPLTSPRLHAAMTIERLLAHVYMGAGRTELRAHGGRITLAGTDLSCEGLVLDAPAHGRVVVGPPGRPARARIGGGGGLRDLVVPVRGRDLRWRGPGVDLRDVDLALELSLSSPRQRRALVRGNVRIDDARVELARIDQRRKPRRGAPEPGGAAGATPAFSLVLDVRVHSPKGGLVVDPGPLPALRLGVDYQVRGTLAQPLISGGPKGQRVYDRFALWLARRLRG